MTRILIPARDADDWQAFLAEPEKQWRTGYSAKALAQCWMSGADFPQSVRRVLDGSEIEQLRGLKMLLGIPEHRVRLRGGGRASQTDLFVLAKATDGELVSIAVEGKVNEPFARLVSEWLDEPLLSEDVSERRFSQPGAAFLQKPFRAEAFVRTVRELLSAQAPDSRKFGVTSR